MPAESTQKARKPWWTPRKVAVGHGLELTVGTLRLTLGHGPDEWRIERESIAEPEVSGKARIQGRRTLPSEYQERYVIGGDSSRLALTPMLADRNVVIRPRQPVFLLSGQKVTLFLSTPIWLKLEVGDPPSLLREMPVTQLSDTWFGPSTREGEICYAGRTHARHHIDELPRRPHRAITPLHIHNKASTPLPLEKFSLPVPMLALYGSENGSLWTQRVTLTREDQSDLAAVRIDPQPPEYAEKLSLLARPRQDSGRSGLVRAFSLLFGNQA
ncbi:MAG: hypothetical protein EA419_09195 [Wenzhouxiangella sp.]|nr:MAG: hypothetical protein EA419_09195 [Wenzhouxiangella sp.]